MTCKAGFSHLDPKIPRGSSRREAFKMLGLQENNEDVVPTCNYPHIVALFPHLMTELVKCEEGRPVKKESQVFK